MSSNHATIALAVTLQLCRLVIGLTGLLWLTSGDELSFSVAIIALLLSFVSSLFFNDARLGDPTAVIIALLLAAHVVFGMYMGMYESSKLYDKVMHILGSSAIAGILISAIHTFCNRHKIELPLKLIILLVFGGTLSAGTLWEVFEFAVDSTGLFYAQRGLEDTMLDLLADVTGALLVVFIYAAIFVRQARCRRTRDSKDKTLQLPPIGYR